MAAKTDNFIVASFALWAGDFAFFERMMKDFSRPRETPSIEKGTDSPEDIIRYVGALRLRQYWQKRGEFKKLAAEYEKQGLQVDEKPYVLETQHLRAAVWRINEREFSMYGYLSDLAWERELFERAQREASRNEPVKSTIPEVPGKFSNEFLVKDSVKGLGIAWTVIGNPFLQVELTDLGLIDVSAIWIEQRLPENAEAVTLPLLRLLRSLDEPTK